MDVRRPTWLHISLPDVEHQGFRLRIATGAPKAYFAALNTVSTLRWLGASGLRFPLAWAILVLFGAFGALTGDGGGSAQLSYLGALSGSACAVTLLRQSEWLFLRMPELRRISVESVVIAFSAGLYSLVARAWSLEGSADSAVISLIHLLALSQIALRLQVQAHAAALILIGLGWFLPTLLGVLEPPALLRAEALSIPAALPSLGLLALGLLLPRRYATVRTS